MFCSTCGSPLDLPPQNGWLRCTRCGAWTAALQSGAVPPAGFAGFAVPPPAALQLPPQAAALLAAVEAAMGEVPAGPPPDLATVPRAPRQPSTGARQLVFAYQGAQRIKLIIGVAFVLIGFPASLPATWGLPGELALALSATPGTGTVTSVARDPSFRINRQTSTKMVFSYRVDGEDYEESFHTLRLQVNGRLVQRGDRVPIEYASLHPGFARMVGQDYSFFGWLAVLFLLMPLAGAALWFTAWRSNRREIHAFRHGTPIVANIVERSVDRSVRQNGQSPRVIRWAFTVQGASYSGSLSHMNHALLDRALPGRQLIALYDPQNPSVNTAWIPG
jgi:hypothetical protein